MVLRLAATASRAQVQRVITPKAFEAIPDISCQRKPNTELSCLPLVQDMQSTEAVDAAFLKITTKAERHLCGYSDCVLLDGSPDPGYVGRGEVLERKWRAVLPPQPKEHGTADHQMTGLALIRLRFFEPICLQWNSIVLLV